MGDFTHIRPENVSRETFLQLKLYHDLLLKWQSKINLISPKTISDAWQRHFVDSMQIFALINDHKKHLIDLGSGAGFPGLVLAIMGIEKVTLIESDRRKCIFLKEVIREIGLLNVTVLNSRIENVKNIKSDIITARALKSLEELIELSTPFLKKDTILIFPKGRLYDSEVKSCNFTNNTKIKIIDSITDDDAKIILLSGLSLN